jgi:putative thioredoxin
MATAQPPVRDVTEADFDREVIQRSFDVPVVVDFWAAWCGPCRSLTPVLEKLATDAAGDWELVKVDVDANQQLATRFHIQGIPAVKAFKDGKPVAEFTGALPQDHVRMWLRQLGPSRAELEVAELGGGDVGRGFDLLVDEIERTTGEEREGLRVELVRLMEGFPPNDPQLAVARRRLSRVLY